MVVTEDFNPVDRAEDFTLLLDRLARFEGPRGVLDPSTGSALGSDADPG